MNEPSKTNRGLVIGLVIFMALGVIACAALGGILVFNVFGFNTTPTVEALATSTVRTPFARATPSRAGATPQPTTEADDAAQETYETLENAVVPNANLRDLAARLKGIKGIPETLPGPAKNYEVGDHEAFWVNDSDTDTYDKVDATLAVKGEHVYLWVADTVDYSLKDARKLVDIFDNQIYPTDREFFGSEWTPGVDNDPRLYVFYTTGMGSRVAGYFASGDSINPQASPYSNGHEMFFISADSGPLDDSYTFTVLAHEFQHMIHWYQDGNEESWLNEGFSDLAAFLNGYDVGGHDWLFAADPDLQLNDWPNDETATTPHYGASFLFVTYFLDRFGEDATKAVVSEQSNGLASIDKVLEQMGAVDPVTGRQITADDVFTDWTIANYLQDSSVGDGRYTYYNYSSAPQTYDTEEIDNCPVDWVERDVTQFGTDYIRLNCEGSFTLSFEGDRQVGLLDAAPHSGDYVFWSNKGDESDMTLTREFDFSQVSGPLTMQFATWYDLETDYDYVHVVASEDGENWTVLRGTSTTDENPVGNSYGWGYNGVSGGWLDEEVDLSDYAGKKVLLRFEYITDAAVNGDGMLIDDIAIPEIGYSSDFESDAGGWEAAGFVRVNPVLPQGYRVTLLKMDGTTEVVPLEVRHDQTISTTVELSGNDVLVVSGTARFTRQLAHYRFALQK